MTKILYMLPSEKFGGAERQGTIAIKTLPGFGIKVTPLVGPGRIITGALEKENINNYIFANCFPDDPKHPLGLLELLNRGFYDIDCFVKSKELVENILKKDPHDLIYATRTFSWIVSGFVTRKTGTPVIWRCGSRFTNELQRQLTLTFMRWSRPKALIFNSKAMKESFKDTVGVPYHIIPPSVDLEKFKPTNIPGLKEKLDLPEDCKTVGIAARPAPEKGPEFVVKIIKNLLQHTRKAIFLWAGESSWKHHVENMFRENDLGQHIRFLGHVANIEEFYAICDVIILTSKHNSIESAPSALIEAMAMGKPIVGTYAGGTPEIITDGENGLLRSYGDVQGFASAINLLLSNGEFALKISRNARERAQSFHDGYKNTQKLANVFKKAV